jgi:hypothetical protein
MSVSHTPVTGRLRRIQEASARNIHKRQKGPGYIEPTHVVSKEVAAFVKQNLKNGHLWLPADLLIDPRAPITLGCVVAVVNEASAEPGADDIVGMYLGAVKGQGSGQLRAVIETGSSIIYVRPELMKRISREFADLWNPKWMRHLGRRILKKLNQCGVMPGEEDKVLHSILRQVIFDRKFLACVDSGAGLKNAEFAAFVALDNWETREDDNAPGKFVGWRCANLLMKFGFPAGNLMGGFVSALNEYRDLRLKIEGVMLASKLES